MAWIESHQSLRLHPKLLGISTELGANRHEIIGHLHCLWWWALDVADFDGWLPPGTTEQVIAGGAEWPTKKANAFLSALLRAGFIEADGERLRLHDWWEFAGKYNAKRAANKQRMKDARAVHVQGLPTNQPNQPNQPEVTPPPTPAPATLALLVAAHENAIGTLSPTKAAILDDWASRIPDNEIGEASIEYAFRQAALQGRPTLAYVEGVLKRLEADGWPREMEREHERTTKAKPRRNGERTAEEIERDPANLAAAQRFIDEHPGLARRQRERRAAAERELGIA